MSLREVEAGVNLLLVDADPTTIPDYEFPVPPVPEDAATASTDPDGDGAPVGASA
jgi:hypothetical protein